MHYGPLMGNLSQDLLQLYEFTTVMPQKDDAVFAHCLNRIREGKQTNSDLDLIASKISRNEDVSDYIHLFSVNRLIDEYNVNVLTRKSGKCFISVASDFTKGDITGRDRRRLLDHAKHIDSRKPQNFPYELHLKESGNYMMTHNVNTSDGLTNGASCQIKMVHTVNSTISVVWVVFPEEDIGRVRRSSNKHLYMSNPKIDKSWTPILKIEKELN